MATVRCIHTRGDIAMSVSLNTSRIHHLRCFHTCGCLCVMHAKTILQAGSHLRSRSEKGACLGRGCHWERERVNEREMERERATEREREKERAREREKEIEHVCVCASRERHTHTIVSRHLNMHLELDFGVYVHVRVHVCAHRAVRYACGAEDRIEPGMHFMFDFCAHIFEKLLQGLSSRLVVFRFCCTHQRLLHVLHD